MHDLALKHGRQMKDLGITVDFAPVVDVADAPDDTVIGDRSFGDNPQTVIDYAGAYAQGLRDAQINPAASAETGLFRSADAKAAPPTSPPAGG